MAKRTGTGSDHVTHRKRTSVGRMGNRTSMSTMNKAKKRSFKKYRGQGTNK